jgi:hypothetical protein
MSKLTTRLYGVNWRVVVAVTSLLTFALTGTALADDGPGW